MNSTFIPVALPPPHPVFVALPCAAQTIVPRSGGDLLSTHFSVIPLLVRTARFTWQQFWRVIMSEPALSDAKGRCVRLVSPLTERPAPLDAEASYAVYGGATCQWCHWVPLGRALLGMDRLEVREVVPGEDGLWKLVDEPGLLKEVYLEMEPKYNGRFTAPLLVKTGVDGGIVSNGLRIYWVCSGRLRDG